MFRVWGLEWFRVVYLDLNNDKIIAPKPLNQSKGPCFYILVGVQVNL